MSSVRITKTIGFSVLPNVAQEVEQIAQEEGRTKSELFREMLRVYRSYRKRRPEPEFDEAWALELMREVEAEKRLRPMSDAAFQQAVEKAQRYGAERAKALGITEEDVDRIVYEERRNLR